MLKEFLKNGNLVLQADHKDIINDIFSNNMLKLDSKYGLTLLKLSGKKNEKGYFYCKDSKNYFCITKEQLNDLRELKILCLEPITLKEWVKINS